MVKEEKDFKKEFEEFARKIKEENNPIFQDNDLEFDDIDNMLNFKEENLNKNYEKLEKLNFEREDLSKYPQIDLETDDIKMSLIIKKDYSKIANLDNRKKEFIKDLKEFIDEFDLTEESKELMKFYD